MEQTHTLADTNKRLKVAQKELEDALSAKIHVQRQQQEEAEIWGNIFAQIGEETTNGAAR